MDDEVLRRLDGCPLQPRALLKAHGLLDGALGGGASKSDEALAEHRLLWMVLRKPLSKDAPRFAPVSHGGEAQEAADAAWRGLSPGQWAWLERRAATTPNPALQAHYNDILWEARRFHGLAKPVRFAEAAAAGYGAWLKGAATPDFWSDVRGVGRRLAELGLTLNRAEWVQGALDAFGGALLRFEAEGGEKPGITAQLAEACLDVVSEARARRVELDLTPLTTVRAVLERFHALHAHPLVGNHRRRAEQLLGRLDAFEGRPDAGRERAIAQSFREEGEFHLKNGSALVAGSFLMEAVAAYAALGDKAMSAEVKRLAREAHGRAVEQMHSYEVTLTVPTQDIEDVLGSLLEPKTWQGIFERSGESPHLVPDLSAPPDGPDDGPRRLSDLVTNVTLSGDRQIASDAGGALAERAQAAQFDVKARVLLLWVPLLRRARGLGLEPGGAVDVLVSSGVVPDGRAASVRQGVLRLLDGDYIASVHILAPQFEAALRHVLSRLGVDVTAYRGVQGGRFQERPISVYFNAEENADLTRKAQDVLGLPLWAWLKFVFVDERGLNVRNRIAHGLVPDAEQDEPLAALVLLAFVRLMVVGRGAQQAHREGAEGAAAKPAEPGR